MEVLIVNKVFKTKAELEAYEEKLSQEYIVFMIMLKEQPIGEPEVYGIDKVLHFGKRI